ARSSAKCGQSFKDIQEHEGTESGLQLLLDMAVRWFSTYVMLDRAEKPKEFINTFVYEIGLQVEKRCKIDLLKLTEAEWDWVSVMFDILGYADHAQQTFSSENEPSLHVGLPALEALHNAWSKRLLKAKYSEFLDAIQAGIDKLSDYYNRTGSSSAYVILMSLS
ncbi:hypothetical protein F5876DRAFT_14328, partial [Lentinula aff. lateritia]